MNQQKIAKVCFKTDNKLNILYFLQFRMKFLLPATLVLVAYAQQDALVRTRNVMPSPIVAYQDPVPEIKEIKAEQKPNQEEKTIEGQIAIQPPIIGNEQFNPNQFIPQDKISEPKTDQILEPTESSTSPFIPIPSPPQPLPMPTPMPGFEEFNPFELNPENERKSKHHGKHGKKSTKKGCGKHMRGPEKQLQNTPFSYEQEQKHLEEGHKRGKFHRNLWVPIVSVALIFTLVGILLAKCFFKIRKCGTKKCRYAQSASANKSSTQIHDQIKEKEQKLNQLKAEYQNKRAIEERNDGMRNEEAYRAHEMEMIQRIQPQRMRAAPQPQYIYPNQVPMGRPVNYYQVQ